jgi:hypothetical protein
MSDRLRGKEAIVIRAGTVPVPLTGLQLEMERRQSWQRIFGLFPLSETPVNLSRLKKLGLQTLEDISQLKEQNGKQRVLLYYVKKAFGY